MNGRELVAVLAGVLERVGHYEPLREWVPGLGSDVDAGYLEARPVVSN